MRIDWRTWLVEWPARAFDFLWTGYWTVIAALSIVCLVNVALLLVAALLGLPLPL